EDREGGGPGTSVRKPGVSPAIDTDVGDVPWHRIVDYHPGTRRRILTTDGLSGHSATTQSGDLQPGLRPTTALTHRARSEDMDCRSSRSGRSPPEVGRTS